MIKLKGNKDFTIEMKSLTFSGRECEPRIEICLGNTCRVMSEDDFYELLFQDWTDWLNNEGNYSGDDE